MNKGQLEVLERIRYAWVHADCAMEKVTPYYRERVRKVIGGDLPPFDYLLRMIAEATNRSVEWLLTGEDEGTRLLANPEFVESLEQLRDGKTVPAKTLEEEQANCPHEETWFDRTVCAEPCGAMHSYCTKCSARVGACEWADKMFLYDGQDLNELCGCGHAAMVHTSGSGNCLALGESRQQDSHCLEFHTKTTEKVDVHAWGDPCDSNCLCEETPMEPVAIADEWHVFTPDGTGSCIGCGGGVEDAIHHGLKTGTTCAQCLHASPHDQGGIGICRVKDCGCDGAQMCEECPHFWVLHTSGDDGCEACDCKAGVRVPRPLPKSLGMGHGPADLSTQEPYTFPKSVTALAQRVWSDDQWAEFFYVDSDKDELMIREDHTDKYGPAVYILTSPNGCSIPLDTLEAVIDALRESGRRAMEDPK